MLTSLNIGAGPGHARKVGFVLVLTFLMLPGLLGSITAESERPVFEGPRMAIDVREKDFGAVTRGEILEATFEVKNVGSEPLKILQVKPG